MPDIHTHRQRDRQAYIHTYRQTRRTGRQQKTDGHTYIHTDGHTNIHTDGQADTYRQTEIQT